MRKYGTYIFHFLFVWPRKQKKLFFLGLILRFSNLNVLHKGLLMQDWVFRLGLEPNFITLGLLLLALHSTLNAATTYRLPLRLSCLAQPRWQPRRWRGIAVAAWHGGGTAARLLRWNGDTFSSGMIMIDPISLKLVDWNCFFWKRCQASLSPRTTDARWGNRLQCTAINPFPLPNF